MAGRGSEKARPSVALFLLSLALGAVVYHEMRSDSFSRLPPPAPVPAVAKVTLPPPLPAFELPPLVDFIASVERPLFLPERRPPEPEEEVVEKVAEKPLEPLKVLVTGVILSSSRSFALVQREGDSEVLQLAARDTIDGWSVKDILADRVVFARGEESQAVELKDRSGQAKPREPDKEKQVQQARPNRRRAQQPETDPPPRPRSGDPAEEAQPPARRGRVRTN